MFRDGARMDAVKVFLSGVRAMEAKRDQSTPHTADPKTSGIEIGRAQAPTGPRGGTTTVTKSGMVKKNLWIPTEDAEVLRRTAFERRVSEAEIIREGLRRALYDDEEPTA